MEKDEIRMGRRFQRERKCVIVKLMFAAAFSLWDFC